MQKKNKIYVGRRGEGEERSKSRPTGTVNLSSHPGAKMPGSMFYP